MDKYIPLSAPNFEGNESKYVNDALTQGWVSTGGEYINQLEKDAADFLKVESTVACQSGTSGLHLSLLEAGVKPEDMVIVPTLTFIAAVNPVRYIYANPVFMDCDDSLCIDPIKLKRFFETECVYNKNNLFHKNTCKKVSALVAVHIFGNMADMEPIMELAQRYNLPVIEDATEALGTYYNEGKYKGRYAGTIGDFGVFSFNGNKIITTGGGGLITANDSNKLKHIRYLSTQAKDDPLFYKHDEVGFNYRMTNLQAALGVAQFEELPDFIRRKNRNYKLYEDLFQGFPLAKLKKFREDTYSNKWFYSLEIDIDKLNVSLKDIIRILNDRKIGTRAIWELIHTQKPYLNFEAFEIERAPYYAQRILNLPCSTNITDDEIKYTVEIIKSVLEENTK